MDGVGWHLITGEYPPREGGVGDYSALVADGLARAGRDVHVWTTGLEGDSREVDGVAVHRTGRGWAGSDLARLGRALDEFPDPRRLLVQYTPNSWGFKGINLGFARWLVARRRRGDRVLTMFHEICYIPNAFDSRPIRRLLPLVQRPMARWVLSASDRIFVSTPRWADLLRPLDPNPDRPLLWLPVPSNIPVVDDPSRVAEVRLRNAVEGGSIVGSFGTFANVIAELLARVLPPLMRAEPGCVALLIGRNGEVFARRLIEEHPDLSKRLVATGGLPPADVSRHLRACDLLVQPYPDGVCGRRGTVMAALSHGVATVSTEGAFTAPLWRESGGIALAPETDPEGFIRLASSLLGDPKERARLGAAGLALYERRFAIERTIEALLAAI